MGKTISYVNYCAYTSSNSWQKGKKEKNDVTKRMTNEIHKSAILDYEVEIARHKLFFALKIFKICLNLYTNKHFLRSLNFAMSRNLMTHSKNNIALNLKSTEMYFMQLFYSRNSVSYN